MGPIWGRQDPGGPHVGPMNYAIWVTFPVRKWTRTIVVSNAGIRIYADYDVSTLIVMSSLSESFSWIYCMGKLIIEWLWRFLDKSNSWLKMFNLHIWCRGEWCTWIFNKKTIWFSFLYQWATAFLLSVWLIWVKWEQIYKIRLTPHTTGLFMMFVLSSAASLDLRRTKS